MVTGETSIREYLLPFDEWVVEICPYRVGDQLWVREPFAMRKDFSYKEKPAKALHYARYKGTYGGDLDMEWHNYGKWRSATQMPREVSRITLDVTKIACEKIDLPTWDACDAKYYTLKGDYAWTIDFATRFNDEAES